MAVGGNADLLNTTAVNALIASDATTVQNFIYWCQRKYLEYNANLSTVGQQTAAGFTAAADQATISTFIGDLNRIQSWLTGQTTIPLGENVLNDLNAIIGIR